MIAHSWHQLMASYKWHKSSVLSEECLHFDNQWIGWIVPFLYEVLEWASGYLWSLGALIHIGCLAESNIWSITNLALDPVLFCADTQRFVKNKIMITDLTNRRWLPQLVTTGRKLRLGVTNSFSKLKSRSLGEDDEGALKLVEQCAEA